MIVELSIENLAIIERAELAFGPGLTALTGETGAGKSLLLDAIELALGDRADTSLVRTGASRATVRLVADLTHRDALISTLESQGIYTEDGLLVIQREVFAEGRSQARINGRLATIAELRSVGALLIDLHGQHEHQSLLHAERHVELLDTWIGSPAELALAAVKAEHAIVSELRSRLSRTRTEARDRELRLDTLRFQIGEIEVAAPRDGEMAELEMQRSRLQHVDRLAQLVSEAVGLMDEGESPSIDSLAAAQRSLADAAKYDSSLQTQADLLEQAIIASREVVGTIRSYLGDLETDPSKLDEVATRIDLLKRLRRKYGDDEASVLQHLAQAKTELEQLEGGEADEATLLARLAEAESVLLHRASELSHLRQEAAARFQSLVASELHELAMEKAVFEVGFEPRAVDALGCDAIEFLFSANPGEPIRSLAKIASGGEISRVMLAIKKVLAGQADVPTLVFDEVDAGIGGRTAVTVARNLESISRHCQVIVITHLPQIAARASSHLHVEKEVVDGRTHTRVRTLPPDERATVIAQMMAGDAVSDASLASAKELLGDYSRPD